jgi:hypothetical protein
MHNPLFHRIGTYKQVSNTILVTDTTAFGNVDYLDFNSSHCQINNVKKGEYYCYLRLNERNSRPARLYVTMKKEFNIADYEWVKEGTISVNSRKAGIFDYKFQKYTDLIMFHVYCDWFLKDEDSDNHYVFDYGVAALTGWGIGKYNVYTHRNNHGKVTAVKLIFIKRSELRKTICDI